MNVIDVGLSMTREERFKVDAKKSLKGSRTKYLKTWDLCKKCYSALYRGIEKGVTK